MSNDDCAGGACQAGQCLALGCTDDLKNGLESDVDCGASCSRCAPGKTCTVAEDCSSLVCTDGVCQAATCTDSVSNGNEGDIDCGGDCAPCTDGLGCTRGAQCASGVCGSQKCVPASCVDGAKNGNESARDCGGSCPACQTGAACNVAADCLDKVCSSGTCRAASCSDGQENGQETDQDCGGSCTPCAPKQGCSVDKDCTSGRCESSLCAEPSCTDKLQNGDETALDCGGKCGACPAGTACTKDSDCALGDCFHGRCASPLVSFIGARVYETGVGPIGLGVGDLNGDGLDDIVGTNEGDASVGVLLNEGGTFSEVTRYPLPAALDPEAAVIRDLDGDGDADVVTIAENTKPYRNTPGAVSVLLNDGKGKLTLDDEYITTNAAHSLSIADLDADGSLDLVFLVKDAVGICWGLGGGKFDSVKYTTLQLPASLVVDNFVGTSAPDLAFSSAGLLTVMNNKGGRVFEAITSQFGSYDAIKVGDINGDGNADLLLESVKTAPLQFLWGDGTGHFTLGTALPASHEYNFTAGAVGDADGDGDLDVGMIAERKTLIWQNAGGGKFNLVQTFGAGLEPRWLKFGNFDRNKGQDLVVSHSGYLTDSLTVAAPGCNVGVFMSEGGRYVTADHSDFGDVSRGITSADFDVDGDLDLAASNYADDLSHFTGTISVFLLDHGTFGPRAEYSLNVGPQGLASADVDGDGDRDIVSASPISSVVTALLNDGKGGFAVQPNTSVAPALDIVAHGGGFTLASHRFGLTQVFGSGGGTLSSATTFLDGNVAERVVYGRLNGADSVVTTYYGGEFDENGYVTVLDSAFKVKQRLLTGYNPTAAAIGDFDGDGVGDLAAVNGEGSNIAEYLSKSGSLSYRGLSYVPYHPGNALTADLNRDGRSDLIVATVHGSTVTVLLSGGSDGFFLAGHYRVGSAVRDIVLGDFDGNGSLDIGAVSSAGIAILHAGAR